MKKNIAFIVGITGQDGAYLAHYLKKKNFTVVGFTRSLVANNLKNLKKLDILNQINLIKYKEDDCGALIANKMLKLKPSQVYILSGLSSVGKSFLSPTETYKSNLIILLSILETCRKKKLSTKIYNSSSTDCFGGKTKTCNEKTIFSPVSPYGRAKSSAHWLVRYYRDFFNVSCVSGIVSNHESTLRSENFVTKKIINYVNNFNPKKKLIMGNTNVHRDWGWAPDFVEAIFEMNNAKKRNDYLISTGKSVSLDYFIKKIFSIRKIDKNFYIANNQKYKRTNEVKKVFCDSTKIKKNLNWKPKHDIDDIIPKLLNNDLF
jgi:GDPmannose 4,6-dehydratase